MSKMGELVEATDQASCSYSLAKVSQWLRRIELPGSLRQYIARPEEFPKTFEALRVLMRCQITTFTYENLTVHYSLSHDVDIRPEVLYQKMMGPDNRNRGGYCMELSIFFYHMLLGLGFNVYMTGVRNRTRTNGVPGGQYQGWYHHRLNTHDMQHSTNSTPQDSHNQHSTPPFGAKVRHGCRLWR